MMSIITPVAQQCELINELDASLFGGKKNRISIDLSIRLRRPAVHTQKTCAPRTPGTGHPGLPSIFVAMSR